MGANMGILPPLPEDKRPRDKRLRYMAVAERAVASFQQWLEVWRGKGVKTIGVGFGGTVTAIQTIVEEQRHFVNRVIRRHVQGVQQVDLPVRAQLRQRDLRPGDDNRLAQVLQHEGERRGGKRHGVGAVQDHEAVVLVVMGFNVIRDMLPVFRRHVGGVHQRLVFVDSKVRHLGAMELRHQRQLTLQVPRDRNIAVV